MIQRKVDLITICLFTAVVTLSACNQTNLGTGNIPKERVGLEGEYDESGLAKQVVKAFQADSDLATIKTVYAAQTGSTIVLKGTIPNSELLDKMVTVAQKIDGVTQVETDQVTVRP